MVYYVNAYIVFKSFMDAASSTLISHILILIHTMFRLFFKIAVDMLTVLEAHGPVCRRTLSSLLLRALQTDTWPGRMTIPQKVQFIASKTSKVSYRMRMISSLKW